MKKKNNKPGLGFRCAAKRVLLGVAGLGLTVVPGGCSSLVPNDKTQTMRVVAVGIPGIAFITRSEQAAENRGDDENRPEQANPVTVTPNNNK